ncbi:hypothetical protein KM043_007198 [Ampulex compressa]|nr:hypothetical protein KM043_007198 [Ampulex compressa]
MASATWMGNLDLVRGAGLVILPPRRMPKSGCKSRHPLWSFERVDFGGERKAGRRNRGRKEVEVEVEVWEEEEEEEKEDEEDTGASAIV